MENSFVKIEKDWDTLELTGLPPSFFKLNRERYLNNLNIRIPDLNTNSVIVIKGGEEIPRYDTDVNYYHFYQESNFYYLTGVREPGLWATLDIKSGECTIFYDQPAEKNQIWMTVVSKEEMAKKYELSVVDLKEVNEFLHRRNMDNIYLLEGLNEYSGKDVIFAPLNFQGDLAYLNAKVKHDKMIYEVLCDTRGVKSENEKDLLKFIGEMTNKAHLEIMKHIKPGMYERDLENVFMTYLSEKYYIRIWAYPCIGGCGGNSATLHYDINDKVIQDGELFLADMGARFVNYTSDVTITIPANGKFTPKQKQIYDIVLKANREVIKVMKPGQITYPQMDKLAKTIILQELKNLGIIKEEFSIDELYDNQIWRVFMPHGLGHFVGLDVHDVGFRNISYKSEFMLLEGNFITVEPGIYFIDFVIDNVVKDPIKSKYLNVDLLLTYKGFGGIRIEDDIFVTADGVINFQESLPRTTEEIEAYMKEHNVHLNGGKK
jgi:Xaa-Pro dipeptidase